MTTSEDEEIFYVPGRPRQRQATTPSLPPQQPQPVVVHVVMPHTASQQPTPTQQVGRMERVHKRHDRYSMGGFLWRALYVAIFVAGAGFFLHAVKPEAMDWILRRLLGVG